MRLVWADYAKGLTILLVVYGHAVVGVAKDVPIDPMLYAYVMKPFSQFRMPTFFFVAGLFAALSIRRTWPEFIERTLLHLVWIFIVWNVLQYAGRMVFAPWANDPIEPIRILLFPFWPINITWFIWALFFYYVIARLCRGLPAALPVAAAAMLAATQLPFDYYAIVQGSKFMIYFLLGVACSKLLLEDGLAATSRHAAVLTALYLVVTPTLIAGGLDDVPILDFGNACLGIAWVLSLCMLLGRHRLAPWLTAVGRLSLPIFVMHTIVTAGAREILLRGGITENPALLVLAATVAGVLGPLAAYHLARRVRLGWLFERPAWFSLRGASGRTVRSAPGPTAEAGAPP